MRAEQRYTEYVRVLSIAGSDSGGGAGVQADLKTFAALGCFGMSAITALTAQNTCGVRAIHAPPPDFLAAQIDAVMDDLGAAAVKVGMLHDAAIVQVVAAAVDRHRMQPLVLDPVMVSATGAVLIEPQATQALVAELFPRASVVTPNLDEAALLLGRRIAQARDMVPAARALQALGAPAVLLKGGHLPGAQVNDVLVQPDVEPLTFADARIATPNLHGAGCTLSSAIAALLAQGQPLPQAVAQARHYVRRALAAGQHVRSGAGVGPLNHGFAPHAMMCRPATAMSVAG